MKKYENEQSFVENFSKDVKNENEFAVNGKEFKACFFEKNKWGQTIYAVIVDGLAKNVNMPTLKKMLGVTWTAERDTSGTAQKTEKTAFVAKTDEELQETAKTVITSVFAGFRKSLKTCEKYGLSFDEMHALFKSDSVTRAEQIAFTGLKSRQETAKKEREAKEQAVINKAQQEAKDKAAKAIAAMQAAGLSTDEIKAMLGL